MSDFIEGPYRTPGVVKPEPERQRLYKEYDGTETRVNYKFFYAGDSVRVPGLKGKVIEYSTAVWVPVVERYSLDQRCWYVESINYDQVIEAQLKSWWRRAGRRGKERYVYPA